MSAEFLYRWECRTCRRHGRWLVDGNTADALGWNHLDRNPSHSNYDVVEKRRRPDGTFGWNRHHHAG